MWSTIARSDQKLQVMIDQFRGSKLTRCVSGGVRDMLAYNYL